MRIHNEQVRWAAVSVDDDGSRIPLNLSSGVHYEARTAAPVSRVNNRLFERQGLGRRRHRPLEEGSVERQCATHPPWRPARTCTATPTSACSSRARSRPGYPSTSTRLRRTKTYAKSTALRPTRRRSGSRSGASGRRRRRTRGFLLPIPSRRGTPAAGRTSPPLRATRASQVAAGRTRAPAGRSRRARGAATRRPTATAR